MRKTGYILTSGNDRKQERKNESAGRKMAEMPAKKLLLNMSQNSSAMMSTHLSIPRTPLSRVKW